MQTKEGERKKEEEGEKTCKEKELKKHLSL
jgi:hypothetical protein